MDGNQLDFWSSGWHPPNICQQPYLSPPPTWESLLPLRPNPRRGERSIKVSPPSPTFGASSLYILVEFTVTLWNHATYCQVKLFSCKATRQHSEMPTFLILLLQLIWVCVIKLANANTAQEINFYYSQVVRCGDSLTVIQWKAFTHSSEGVCGKRRQS